MKSFASLWVRRLASHVDLSREEQRVLEELGTNSRSHGSHEYLVKAGDPADRVLVVLEGLACQCKLLPDGRRQILSYLFAGDMCDPRQLLLDRIDCSMATLMPTQTLTLTPGIMHLLERHPNIARAMTLHSLTQQAIAREWLVNLGHRTALERLGHLICEMYVRLEAVGLTTDHSFELPLTQAELGDTLALSAVHVNRTLMELRRLKLVTFQHRQLHIHDYPALRAAAGFEPIYLSQAMPLDGSAPRPELEQVRS